MRTKGCFFINKYCPFLKNDKKPNGKITVIHKSGFKHHPHSLPDPTPIVEYLMSVINASK